MATLFGEFLHWVFKTVTPWNRRSPESGRVSGFEEVDWRASNGTRMLGQLESP